MTEIAVKKSDIKSAEYMVGIEAFDPEMLIFIDKTGCDERILGCQYGCGVSHIS